jgi:hypothetical protein
MAGRARQQLPGREPLVLRAFAGKFLHRPHGSHNTRYVKLKRMRLEERPALNGFSGSSRGFGTLSPSDHCGSFNR